MRLLVGFDGSEQGRDALVLAGLLASPEPSSALVVTVLPYDPLPLAMVELERNDAAEAEPLLAEARKRLAGLAVETRVFGGGSVGGILTDLAENEEFDAIAIGSSHRGTIGRALLGGVGRGLLQGAPCPVAVAPRGYAQADHDRLGRIAIAYDGTSEAEHALAQARALAEAHGASVRVLTVDAPITPLPGTIGYIPVDPPHPKAVLEEGVRAVGSGLRCEGEVLKGPPADTLAGACEEGVDLLVAGSRGYGPFSRVLLGSVTTKLIGIAPCPVLVVPRA